MVKSYFCLRNLMEKKFLYIDAYIICRQKCWIFSWKGNWGMVSGMSENRLSQKLWKCLSPQRKVTSPCLLVIMTRFPLLLHDTGHFSLARSRDHSHSDWLKVVFTWLFMHSLHVWESHCYYDDERCGKLRYWSFSCGYPLRLIREKSAFCLRSGCYSHSDQ